MQDFGDHTLDQTQDPTHWKKAVARFAHIQAQSAQRPQEWLELGCPDLRLHRLKGHIDHLLADGGAMLLGEPQGLTWEEATQLRALGPRLKAACDQLAAYGMPDSLVHNDFHAGNIVADDTQLIIFDWADSAVSCPLFSLTSLFDAENYAAEIPRGRLQNAYSQAWRAVYPTLDLEQAFERATPVGALYHAVNHLRVVEQIEAHSQWELEATVPYWLRKVLDHQHLLP
jgi:hypothetical protein